MQKRLFLGIAPAKDQVPPLAELQRQLSTIGRPAKLANLHMTLFFIGMSDNDTTEAIEAAIDNIKLPRFEVSLTTLRLWHKPKIICLAGVASDPCLRQIVTALRAIAAMVGLAPDPHDFTPHITLIRKAKILPELSGVTQITLQPQQLHLYHSVSGSDGVEYHIINSWPLV
jgi:2'-5' RNA ligase